jgi:hypothetical protein
LYVKKTLLASGVAAEDVSVYHSVDHRESMEIYEAREAARKKE